MNPLASLAMPKSDFTSMQLNQLVSSKNLTNGKFFIGMTKVGNQWIWDDGTPVFVRRKSLGSWGLSLNEINRIFLQETLSVNLSSKAIVTILEQKML